MTFRTTKILALLVAGVALLAGCERPPMDSVQNGYRGTGMVEVYNPSKVAAMDANNTAPPSPPPSSPDGPRAKDAYQNVKVLGDVSAGQFIGLMTAMTTWVAPKDGCAYCHNPQNFADDSKYTKTVARKMIEMTRHINGNWQKHVADTGVTCYTCHRGNAVPANVWAMNPGPKQAGGFAASRNGQNLGGFAVPAYSSLPYDPFTTLFAPNAQIRVVASTALPGGTGGSTDPAGAI